MFTKAQEIRALHYSINWLAHEIQLLKIAVEMAVDDQALPHLKQRLAELEKDYADFSAINV